jgi:hypothetical protein
MILMEYGSTPRRRSEKTQSSLRTNIKTILDLYRITINRRNFLTLTTGNYNVENDSLQDNNNYPGWEATHKA